MTPLAAVSNPPLTFRSGILEQELTSTFLGLGATDEPHFYPPSLCPKATSPLRISMDGTPIAK